MQHEWVGVGAEFGDDERHPLRHQPRNEMHVTGEAIEFCNDDGTFRLASPRKRAAEFGAAIQSVGTLPGLDLDMRDRPDPASSHILPPFNICASSFSTEILLFQLLYAVVANSGRLTREASADGGEA